MPHTATSSVISPLAVPEPGVARREIADCHGFYNPVDTLNWIRLYLYVSRERGCRGYCEHNAEPACYHPTPLTKQ